MISLLVSNSLITAGFLLTAFITGIVIMAVCRVPVKDYVTSFHALLVGSFSVVSVFAIYHTRGLTVLSGFALIGILALVLRKRHGLLPDTAYAGSIKFVLLRYTEVTSVAISIVLYKLLFFNGSLNDIAYLDNVFYAKTSDFLLSTGKENTTMDYVLADGPRTPYHYFDLWLNAILLEVSKANKVTVMILATASIGIAVTWSGFLALASTFDRGINLKTKILCLLFLFCSGIYYGDIINISFLQSTSVFTRNVVNYSKLFPIYWLCLLLFIHLRKQSRPAIIILILLCLPLVNISTAPGTFLLVAAYIGYLCFTDRKSVLISIIEPLAIGTFLLVFYASSKSHNSDYSFSIAALFSGDNIKTIINIIIGAGLQFALIYLPLLMAAGLYFIKREFDFKMAVSIAATYLCFVLPWGLFNSSPNSVQLFSNFFVPFTVSLCFLVVLMIMKSDHMIGKRHRLAMLLIIGLPVIGLSVDIKERVLMRNVSREPSAEIISAKRILERIDNPLGVYFRSHYDWASKFPVFGALDQGLQEYVNRKGFHTISLSIFDIPLDSTTKNYQYEKSLVTNSTFAKYLAGFGAIQNARFNTRTSTKLVDYQLKFIQDYKVDYVLAQNDYDVPEEIIERFNRSLALRELGIVLYY